MDKKDKVAEKVVVQKTESDKLWDSLKDKGLSMFALPEKPISDYCSRAIVEPNKLYLTTTVPAFLPALEDFLGSAYSVELVDKYIVVTRAGK
jgi:hypothetical protein